ncbi:MAG: hypothetical protein K2M10_01770 [Muribaculaceae bacterium]|nr:hypothetical protein [Muribaculaceae bacterium]
MRTPKLIGKEWSNALMSFHEHSFADYFLVLRKSDLYSYDGLCKRQHFVNTHLDF